MLASAKPVGVIKKAPEDFIVREDNLYPVSDTKLTGATSPFTMFTLTKRGVEGDTALTEVARQLNVARGAVSAAGRKDSCAVTTQRIVVAGDFTPTFAHDRIWLHQVGPAHRPLRRGHHSGNMFSIMVYTDARRPAEGRYFRNYFGPQRFGSDPKVGRYLLEGDLVAAFVALTGTRNQSARDKIAEQGYSEEETMRHPYLASVREYAVLQWQSYLWNELARSRKETSARDRLPLWSLDSAYLYTPWWNPSEVDGEMLRLIHVTDRPLFAAPERQQVIKRVGGWRHDFRLRPGAFATVYLATLYEVADASLERLRAGDS